MSIPTLSIIMPAYNPGHWSVAAVESAISNMGPHDELLIQDNCSTDGWTDGLPPDRRISVVVEKDTGQADALNRALARASGDWIVWLNADDVIAPGVIRSTLDRVGPETQIVYGAYSTIDDEDRTIRRFTPPEVSLPALLRRGCVLYSGAFAARTEFLRTSGGFDPSYHYTMDYELFLRLWSGGPATSRVPSPVMASLRLHDGTKTSDVPWRFVREARRARRAHARGVRMRLLAAWQTASHSLTVAATPVRSSRLYRQLRGRGKSQV